MSFGHALYYPRINLTNKNWLKQAFLFWDKISRIVPASVQPQDDEDIIRIKCETDFIDNHYVDPWETSSVFRPFSELLERLVDDIGFRNSYWHRHRRDFDRQQLENPSIRDGIFRRFTQLDGTYIHAEKLDPRTMDLLLQLGLAVPESGWSGWVRIDGEMGFIYMSLLAKIISENTGMPIVTDADQSFVVTSQCDRFFTLRGRDQLEAELGKLLISAYIPKDINMVSIDKLIDFRNKYSDVRFDFFEYIRKICAEIPEVDNQDALKDALQHYVKGLKEKCENLNKCYKNSKIETISTFLAIGIPTAFVTGFEFVPAEVKKATYGMGIGFGVVSAIGKVRKERSALRKEPLSYLLNLRAEFSETSSAQRMFDLLSGVRRF